MADTEQPTTDLYIAGCVTGQSYNSENCHTQGVIIGAKSMYIVSLDVPPENI